MKNSVLTFACLVSTITAFAPLSSTNVAPSTALNLFGGKKEGGDKGGAGGMGGMMDQLAMFKKAQEIATKKQAIEKELQLLTFDGTSTNGKVTVRMKYVPSANPMDPQPEFEVQSFDFGDTEWFESSAPSDITAAATEAYRAGVQATMLGSEEKFKVLAEDLKAMMSGK